MQANRRLVEHIKHATQLRSDLCRESDPLAFAAGKCRRRAIECQIAQTDSLEEPQPADNLAQNRTSDLFFTSVKCYLLESFDSIVDRQRSVFSNSTRTHLHRQGIGTQTTPTALATHGRRNQLLDCEPDFFRRRFVQSILKPTKRSLPLVLIRIKTLGKSEPAVDAVQKTLTHFLRQLLKRRLRISTEMFADSEQRAAKIRGTLLVSGAHEPELVRRLPRLWDQLEGVDLHHSSQAVAAFAGAVRGVKRKRSWLEWRHVDAAINTSHAF